MMNYSCGCHTLVMLLLIIVAAGENNPLLELLSNRDEVVQIAGYGEEKLSTVLITGSVTCQPQHQPHAWPLQGAWVGLKCHSHGRKWKGKGSVVARGVTDEFGEFIIDLPSQLHAVPNLEKVCSVKIDRIPKRSFCRAVGVKKQKELSLYSFGNGIRTYNAGNIRI
ncbi:hypothetical protein VIGAN_01539900 [Vigna angularis var. angularis]|uniref:Pollen Ole e 1 allergen and extensin family protein n=1 Tax=Vigna angularis var. angularis TaxID=157739 RepID=A0A0S3R9G6_PHAAN|nr:uncharacterized protein LOC108330210 [Vigna angularis]BAT77300.1 hypothetical protein VIGAN_01539900 [Vigna angularis var. angularis]